MYSFELEINSPARRLVVYTATRFLTQPLLDLALHFQVHTSTKYLHLEHRHWYPYLPGT
jgi:hypothetical protein